MYPLAVGQIRLWSEQRAVVFEDPKRNVSGTFLSLKPYMKYFDIDI